MLLQRTFLLVLAAAALGRVKTEPQRGQALELWAFLAPVVRLDDDERRRLNAGGTVVKMLDPVDPSHLVVFAGSRIDVTPQEFAERIRNSAQLWVGPKVPRAGTISTPIRAEDIAGMSLRPDDLEALRRCRPGDCEVKLSRAEIARIRAAIDGGARAWETALSGNSARSLGTESRCTRAADCRPSIHFMIMIGRPIRTRSSHACSHTRGSQLDSRSE